MAQSIGIAVVEDVSLFDDLISQEVQTQNDHEMALQLQNGDSEGQSARQELHSDIDKLTGSDSGMNMNLLAVKLADIHDLTHPSWISRLIFPSLSRLVARHRESQRTYEHLVIVLHAATKRHGSIWMQSRVITNTAAKTVLAQGWKGERVCSHVIHGRVC